jgi:hypothetical protein
MSVYPFSLRLDPWPADYGSEVVGLEPSAEGAEAEIDCSVERSGPWAPIAPPADAVNAVPALACFVDGVRRIDARILGRRDGAMQMFHGAFGSYAVGFVEARLDECSARFGTLSIDRVVATGAGEILPEPVWINGALEYRPISTAEREPVAIERAIHDEMRRMEERIARELAERDALVLVDGPLTFQEQTRGFAVGWVKRIQELYLPAAELVALFTLPAATRTPLFALRSSRRFARYSWFVRLAAPRLGDSELSGLVRCEVAEHVGAERAARLADATALVLPRFAAVRGLHARAPQNLLPIAALEQRLRRELGDAHIVHRYLQARIAEAARETSP